jgi:hypothetical protein
MKKALASTGFSAILALALVGGVRPQIAAAAHHRHSTAGAIVTCPMFVIQKTLIQPRPHSIDVPRGVGVVHVSGVDLHASLTLKSASGRIVSGTPIAPPQRDHTTPVAPMETLFAIPPLDASMRYDVTVREIPGHGAPTNCPNTLPTNLGSFTTL